MSEAKSWDDLIATAMRYKREMNYRGTFLIVVSLLLSLLHFIFLVAAGVNIYMSYKANKEWNRRIERLFMIKRDEELGLLTEERIKEHFRYL